MGTQELIDLLCEIEWSRITRPHFDNKFNGFKAKFTKDQLETLSEEDKVRIAIKQFNGEALPNNQDCVEEEFSLDRLKNAGLIVEPYSALAKIIRDTLDQLPALFELANPNSDQQSKVRVFMRDLITFHLNPVEGLKNKINVVTDATDRFESKFYSVVEPFQKNIHTNIEDEFYKVQNTVISFLEEPDLARIRKALDYIQIPLGSYTISMAASGRDDLTHNLLFALTELANYPNKEKGDDAQNEFVIDKIKEIYKVFNKKYTDSNDAVAKKRDDLEKLLNVTYEIMDNINDGRIPVENTTLKLKTLKKLAHQFAERNGFEKKYFNAERVAIKNGRTILDYTVNTPDYSSLRKKEEKEEEKEEGERKKIHKENLFSSRIEGIKNTFVLFNGWKQLSFATLWFNANLSTLSFTRHSRALYNIIHILYAYDLEEEFQDLISIKEKIDTENDEDFAKILLQKLLEIFEKIKNFEGHEKNENSKIGKISEKLRNMPFRNVHLRDKDDLFSDLLNPLRGYINEITQDLYGESFIIENDQKKYINIEKLKTEEEKNKIFASSDPSVPQKPSPEKQKRRNTKKKIKTFQFWFSIIVAISEACAVAVFGATIAGFAFPPSAPFVGLAFFIGSLTVSAFASNWSLFAWASGKGLEEVFFNLTKDERGKEVSQTKKKLLIFATALALLTSPAYGFLSYHVATLSAAGIVKFIVAIGIIGGASAIPGGVIIVLAAVIGICLFAGLTLLYYRSFSRVIKDDQLYSVKNWLSERFYMKDFWRKLNSWESWKHIAKCILYALPVALAIAIVVFVTISSGGVLSHQSISALQKTFGFCGAVATKYGGVALAIITKLGESIFDTITIVSYILSAAETGKSSFLAVGKFCLHPITPITKAVTMFLDDPIAVYAKVLSSVLWGATKLITLANAFGYGSGGASESSINIMDRTFHINNKTVSLLAGVVPDTIRSGILNDMAMNELFNFSLPSVQSLDEKHDFFSRISTFRDFIVQDYSLPPSEHTAGKIAWHVAKSIPKAIIHSAVAVLLTTLALPIAIVWVPAKLMQIAWRVCSEVNATQEKTPCLPPPAPNSGGDPNLNINQNTKGVLHRTPTAEERITDESGEKDIIIRAYPSSSRKNAPQEKILCLPPASNFSESNLKLIQDINNEKTEKSDKEETLCLPKLNSGEHPNSNFANMKYSLFSEKPVIKEIKPQSDEGNNIIINVCA